MILDRMSIDQKLFRKELMKAYKSLSEEDANKLHVWAIEKYPELVSDLSPSYNTNMAS